MGIKYPEPKTPQVVYVRTPVPASTETPAASQNTEPEKSEEEVSAELRRQNLLGRSRSRFGTILTGFRGFLSAEKSDNNRKTLLGE